MALTKFYKDDCNWVIGSRMFPAGSCISDWDSTETNVKIYLIAGYRLVAEGLFSSFCDVNGDAYSTRQAFDEATDDFFVEALPEGVPSVILSNINTKTITGSTEQSTIPSIYRGSNVIKKCFWIKDGARIHITSFATLTTVVGQTATLKIKLGDTALLASTETLPNNLNDTAVYVDIYITYIGNNQVRVSGFTLIQTAQGLAAPYYRRLLSADNVSIDTSIDLVLDMTYKFSGTGNTLITRMTEVVKY